MQTFKTVLVNPSRRDLIKRLAVIGALGSSGLLQSVSLYGMSVEKSAGQLAGNSTWKEEEHYDALRRAMLWRVNAPERYPDVIVQASSEQEIQQALQFATENDLQVVCRSIGHNTAGAVLRNGGMLLDISSMSDISVDAKQMTALVQPGLNMHYCYQKLAEHGLIFPLAECHGVAMGGYLLGGGLPPVSHVWGKGPACYSIISADVILANGEKVVASKDENADIYWAIRGVGPGFFGVVSRYQLQLYQHPETIMQSSFIFSLDVLPDVISILDKLLAVKDERTAINLALIKDPDSTSTTVARLKIIVVANRPGNSEAEAKQLLAPYAQSNLSSLSTSRRMNQVIQFADLMYSPDRSYRNNSNNIWTNDARALLAIVEHYKKMPADSELLLALSHGRNTGIQRKDACYSSAGLHFLSSHLLWKGAENDDANNSWYKELNEILYPFATSHYVNQLDNEQHPSRIRASFSEENWQRLTTVRKKYDPDNRFFSYLGFE
ncbi:MAG: FAD-binding oxidoreductase [Gammaproteobacteria bacterium]|jgi:FAD/FMN-containing dehydrogenase|nr:FAD-binding oxidoreductase [Gammaproteobacteria bacterium]